MDVAAWLRDYQEQSEQRLGRAERARAEIQAASASAQSPDGAVRLTVGATGALTALELGPKAEQLGRAQLAELILRTSREAHRRAAERMAAAVHPLVGDSQAMAFLESHIPPPEPATPETPATPASSEDAEYGSILRRG